jgi:hypothetical protein
MANEMAAGGPGWSPWRIVGWGLAAALLALPAVAMQFTTEVDWDAPDFVIMGIVIVSVGLGMEYLIRRSTNPFYRAGAIVALLVTFLTIWVNLAVGMIGDDNPYNLLFAGVLGIALVGSIAARFAPRGMALVMLVTAVAQAAVGAGGLWSDPRGAIFSMVFAMPWLLAAALFALAARE